MFGTQRNFHATCARCEWCDSPVSTIQGNFIPVWGKFKMRQKLKCMQCCRRGSDPGAFPTRSSQALRGEAQSSFARQGTVPLGTEAGDV